MSYIPKPEQATTHCLLLRKATRTEEALSFRTTHLYIIHIFQAADRTDQRAENRGSHYCTCAIKVRTGQEARPRRGGDEDQNQRQRRSEEREIVESIESRRTESESMMRIWCTIPFLLCTSLVAEHEVVVARPDRLVFEHCLWTERVTGLRVGGGLPFYSWLWIHLPAGKDRRHVHV